MYWDWFNIKMERERKYFFSIRQQVHLPEISHRSLQKQEQKHLNNKSNQKDLKWIAFNEKQNDDWVFFWGHKWN